MDGSIAAVVGAEDAVLEAARVLDVDVDLAVLAVLGRLDIWADRGDVGVEDQGKDGPVGRDGRADGALRAASSTIADTTDGHLTGSVEGRGEHLLKTHLASWGGITEINARELDRRGGDEGDKTSKEPLHFGCL